MLLEHEALCLGLTQGARRILSTQSRRSKDTQKSHTTLEGYLELTHGARRILTTYSGT